MIIMIMIVIVIIIIIIIMMMMASRLGQFWKILKTLVQLILNSTWPHVITYTNCAPLSPITITYY